MLPQPDATCGYAAADRPLAVTHEVVPGASHSGILKADMTFAHVRTLVGGIE